MREQIIINIIVFRNENEEIGESILKKVKVAKGERKVKKNESKRKCWILVNAPSCSVIIGQGKYYKPAGFPRPVRGKIAGNQYAV